MAKHLHCCPGRQFTLLAEKYTDKGQERLLLPASMDEFLASHALSLTSRDRLVFETQPDTPENFASMATAMVQQLRQAVVL